jgi:L-lysine 6-transaminase
MVRFTLYLEIIEKENLVAQASETGAYLLSQLEQLSKEHSNISNARGKGLFCAFDLPSGDDRDVLGNLIAKEGALILGCGLKSIRFRPHLNITRDEIDHAISIIQKALSKL